MPVYISPSGYAALYDEYDFLVKSERPRITAEVQYAASMGDRSENAEYIYGKKRLRQIDSRLRFLKKRMEALEVVDPREFTGTVIRFGARVTVEDAEGDERTYTIVGPDEIDAAAGLISYQSPLGRALIGREPDDEIQVRTPGGLRELTILAVAYPRGET